MLASDAFLMRAAVVVAGDLGRSPRMQYHAHALAVNGVDVDFVGYDGAALPARITRDPRITVHRIAESRLRFRGGSTIGYPLLASIDAVRLALRFLRALMRVPRPDLLLVQNPPALPTLPVAGLVARLRKGRLVIDWHNLGYTQLAVRLGPRHPAVRLARRLETSAARLAHAHLCVSRAMSAFLDDRLGIPGARVLYDRPASAFAPLEPTEREQLRQALFTRLEIRTSGAVGLIVSPTSWTTDEDFDLVIDAVPEIEERVRAGEAGHSSRRFPDLVILVTGDGARRAAFERRVAGLPAGRVQVRTRWIDPDEYPRVIGGADLGLCVHRSSSGLDIPMKLVDLFGAGVPVCALDYGACLAERIQDGDNGLLFSNARQLAELIVDLFEAFPGGSRLERLRAGARRAARPTWEEGWAAEARASLLSP